MNTILIVPNSKIRDTFVLDEDCLDILKDEGNKSEFVRESIKHYKKSKQPKSKMVIEI